MKKIFSSLFILLFAGSLLISSCSSNMYCPAYPPSVYSGDNTEIIDQTDSYESIEIVNDRI
jgi:hypothetical protein